MDQSIHHSINQYINELSELVIVEINALFTLLLYVYTTNVMKIFSLFIYKKSIIFCCISNVQTKNRLDCLNCDEIWIIICNWLHNMNVVFNVKLELRGIIEIILVKNIRKLQKCVFYLYF